MIQLLSNPQTKDKPMKRNLQIIGGTVTGPVGLGLIMPALALLRTQGALPGADVALLLLGVLLSLAGIGAAIAGIRQSAWPRS